MEAVLIPSSSVERDSVMGSHAKTRTTGRKTALGALAVGATLTGVGLTAAALDPATAVLSADAGGTGTAIQLSGLADPVAISPATRTPTFAALSSAPAAGVGALAGSGAAAVGSTVHRADSAASDDAAGSTPSAASTESAASSTPETGSGSAPAADGSGQSAIQPIRPGSDTLTSGYTGKHRQVRSAPTPTDATASEDPLGSNPLSGLLEAGSNPLSGLLGAGGLSGLLGSVPLLGGL